MPEARAPRLFTVPATRPFADALATGLVRAHAGDPLALARGLVLLPNNRSKRAMADAFVRASGGALLLPRLVAIGDPGLDEGGDALIDPVDAAPVPPAVAPLQRRLMLARLVEEERARAGQPVDAGEAVRLAGELARTLDQLLVEDVAPAALAALDVGPELSEHWEANLRLFRVLLDRWPDELARIGRIDLADRRGRLLERLAERWRRQPPPGFVCAAGITDTAPAVARLLRCVADLADGTVVLAGLGTGLSDEEWDLLGEGAETHPQFALRQLLERMGVHRSEFRLWRSGEVADAGPVRGKAIASAMAPAALTRDWWRVPAAERRLTGVRAAELATPAEEAQAIALALREALEEPGRTAALVTPDRALARRVAAHLGRWGIAVDDTAGRPLSILPPGTLLLAIAEAAAQDFAPLPLLALVKHPLVRAGDRRLAWLDGARALDRALRGPRPAPGLPGLDAHLAGDGRERARGWWHGEARPCLATLAGRLDADDLPLADALAGLREAVDALAGDGAWAGPAGRAAADLLAGLEADAAHGPATVARAALAPMLRVLMDEVAVRPPQGGHPRLAIYGLIEARLQGADLLVLGGLNEGVWPPTPAPDPWLAPRVRRALGLPGLERRIGIAAHDFAQGLGAPAVLLTRARRDARAPTLPSRFWLRLEALVGERFERDAALEGWARALDRPGIHQPAQRPQPSPPAALRPRAISVTEVDRLKADPYAFYARRVLRLLPLDPVDADPSAAWRGTAVHDVLERWAREDDGDPAKLAARAERFMAEANAHPLLRALWWPRLAEAIDWIAALVAEQRDEGRRVLAVEGRGEMALAGVTLSGRFDRIDRLADGRLAVVDYKTGQPPSGRAVRDGYSLQLGLLGLIAEHGGFAGVDGRAGAFEYWSLARRNGRFGFVDSPVDARKRDPIDVDEFTRLAEANFVAAAREWLIGTAPFTAKLHPEYAPYADYDQLMRLDEWYGRERPA
jgi:ATP-dependent helicase/nuclease subunit B